MHKRIFFSSKAVIQPTVIPNLFRNLLEMLKRVQHDIIGLLSIFFYPAYFIISACATGLMLKYQAR